MGRLEFGMLLKVETNFESSLVLEQLFQLNFLLTLFLLKPHLALVLQQ